MKKTLCAVLIGALAFTSTVATAQPYGRDQHRRHDSRQWRDSDRDGRSDRSEWNRDRDRDGRPDQYDRYDNRRDRNRSYSYGYRSYGSYPSYGGGYYQPRGYWGSYPYYDSYGGWRTGQVYPYYNRRGYVIDDYWSYGLPAPRAGYRYYRDDSGNVVMAAIAGGLIGLVLGGVLNDNDRGHYYRHR